MKCILCNSLITESNSLEHYKTHNEDFDADPRVQYAYELGARENNWYSVYTKMTEKFKLNDRKKTTKFFFDAIMDRYDNFIMPLRILDSELSQCLKKRAPIKKKEEKKEEKESEDLLLKLYQKDLDDEKKLQKQLLEVAKPRKKKIIKLEGNVNLAKLKLSPKPVKPIKSKLDLTGLTLAAPIPRKNISLMGDLAKKSPKLKPKEIRSLPPLSLETLQKHKPKIAAPKLKTLSFPATKPQLRKRVKMPSPPRIKSPSPAKKSPAKSPARLPSPAKKSPARNLPSPASPLRRGLPSRSRSPPRREEKEREDSASEPGQTILSFMQMKNPRPKKIMNAPLLKKFDQSSVPAPPLILFENGEKGKERIEDALYDKFSKLYKSSDAIFFFKQFLSFNGKALEDFKNRPGVDAEIWNFLSNEMEIYVIYTKMNTALRKKFSAKSVPEGKINEMLSKESGKIQEAAIKFTRENRRTISTAKDEDLLLYIEKYAAGAFSSFKSEIKKVEEPPTEKEISELYKYYEKQKKDYNDFNVKYAKTQEYDPASVLLEPRILKLARLGMPDYDIAFILATDIEIIRTELNIISLIDYVKNNPKDADMFSVNELMSMFAIAQSDTTYRRISFYKGLA